MAIAVAAVLVVLLGVVAGATVSRAGADSSAIRSAVARPTELPRGALRFTPPDPGHHLVPDDDDVAFRTRTSGPLLLFLAATGERPVDYQRLLSVASHQGYHVLGLDYYNIGRSVSATCGHDATCYGRLERNRFDGSGPFAGSRVDPANSIEVRLRLSLQRLTTIDPHGGWGAYLRRQQVQWPDVVVAGHSQGGGIAAWIAHTRRVRGLLMFGSPIVTDGTTTATWLHTASATPPADEYGFDNSHDAYFPKIVASWTLLGLGDPHDVTSGADPEDHALVTTLQTPHAHIGMAADTTPIAANGRPVYLPVWTWMLQRFR